MADRLTIDYSKESLLEVKRALEALDKGAKRIAAKSALSAAASELAAAKSAAPEDTGALRRGLVIHMERNKPAGKQVFDVYPTPHMNSVFQKPILKPGLYGGKSKSGYYPASMEYGFRTQNGKVEGEHYLGGTMDANTEKLKQKMMREIEKSIDEAWDG